MYLHFATKASNSFNIRKCHDALNHPDISWCELFNGDWYSCIRATRPVLWQAEYLILIISLVSAALYHSTKSPPPNLISSKQQQKEPHDYCKTSCFIGFGISLGFKILFNCLSNPLLQHWGAEDLTSPGGSLFCWTVTPTS